MIDVSENKLLPIDKLKTKKRLRRLTFIILNQNR